MCEWVNGQMGCIWPEGTHPGGVPIFKSSNFESLNEDMSGDRRPKSGVDPVVLLCLIIPLDNRITANLKPQTSNLQQMGKWVNVQMGHT